MAPSGSQKVEGQSGAKDLDSPPHYDPNPDQGLSFYAAKTRPQRR